MNAHSPIVAEETAISFVAEPQTPLLVLTDHTQAEALFSRIRAEIDAFVPDLTTAKGRDAIKSLAFKVTKTRTAVEVARKDATEEWRKQTDTVNAAGRNIKARLEALEDEARKPLTEWETAEKARVEAVAARLGEIEQSTNVFTDDSAAAVAERIAGLEAMTFDPAVYRDSLERAETARAAAVSTLTGIHARLVQEEADRAELARLRQEKEEREAREQAERAEREAAEAAAARAAEAKAEEDARAEREAEARSLAAANAAEEARQAAERAAQEALAEQQRQHQAELDRIQREKDEAQAAERREREEAERREKNRAHVAKIMGAAKLAIMGLGVSEEQAVAVVKAIKAGSVPNVSIQF